MQGDAPDVPLHERLVDVLAGNPADNGFEVQYRPIVRLAGNATVAVEAVAHWQHPIVGKVDAEQFMSAAERTGLTGVLEDFILNQACADADALTAAYGLDVPVHVNVSARRLASAAAAAARSGSSTLASTPARSAGSCHSASAIAASRAFCLSRPSA